MSEIEDAKRGKYNKCIKGKIWEGFSQHEAETACAKYLEDDDSSPDEFNLLFTDTLDRKEGESDNECLSRKISIISKEHPEWKHEKVVAVGHAYCGLSKGDAIKSLSVGSIVKRSTSLSLSKFSTLIKAMKTRKKGGLKVGGMGMIPQNISLPMKNLNRLQTKMEKVVTAESKLLTAEQFEQRKQYAKYMRKQDADLSDEPDLSDEEYIDTLETLYDSIIEYYPELTPEEAVDRAFMPPQGDKAWIMSDEAEIISINDGLNNIIKAPIILAKEMVQEYRNEKGEIEFHFKPYDELKDAAILAEENGPLDIIIEHQDIYDDDKVIGYVKNIKAHDDSKTIRGMGYFHEAKLPDGLKQMIKNGEIISVSIGFLAILGDGGEWMGQIYQHKQQNIILRHLAVCLESIPRCPADVCGINLKDSNNENKKIYSIINKDSYYYNICNIVRDSKKETNNKNIIDTNLEKKTMQTDADKEGHIAATEPDDLEAILVRLRMLLAGNIDLEYAAPRILAALGINKKSDSKMDEKEFQDAISLKDSELGKIQKDFEDAKAKIKVFEEEKRKNLISNIKKFAADKFSDEELAKEELKSLEKIADAVLRFAPSEKAPPILPITPKGDKDEMEKQIKDGVRIDPFSIYDDVNKEFNMDGL